MNSFSKLVLVIAAPVAMSIGCKDDKKVAPANPDPVAGKGGSTNLRVRPRHHTKTIDSCTVYIKYNTSNTPTAYDDSAEVVVSNGDTVATFAGLKRGKYYLYGRGYDEGIFQIVDGGAPYTITQDSVTLNIDLPVTEDH